MPDRRAGLLQPDRTACRIRTLTRMVVACVALFVALAAWLRGPHRLGRHRHGSIRNRDFKDGTCAPRAKRDGFGGAIKERR